MLRPFPRPEAEDNLSYMSVKDAVQELRTANIYNKHTAIPSARLSPDWGLVHREDQIRRTGHSSLPSASGRSATAPPLRAGSGRGGGDNWATQSSTSSVPYRYQERGQTPGGGCASPSGLNSAYTYYYGTEPLNPAATNNEANRVGSLSMFGSQAMSGKVSSGSFGFGTATREQSMQLYISPAHLRANLCKFSPGPATYGANSSLSRQVLSSKHSYQSSSFGLEERFDPHRRFALATCTPGPGAYRV
jgi:hypothetical protein